MTSKLSWKYKHWHVSSLAIQILAKLNDLSACQISSLAWNEVKKQVGFSGDISISYRGAQLSNLQLFAKWAPNATGKVSRSSCILKTQVWPTQRGLQFCPSLRTSVTSWTSTMTAVNESSRKVATSPR
jgi:hypothetical protein